MGKEELLDALAALQAASSVEGISAQFYVVHEGETDIHRKRWRFLEDSCSVVLRQVFDLVSDIAGDEMQEIDVREVTISTVEGVELSLQFLEPLIHSTLSLVDALEDEQEATNQRSVLVAALLYLFAKISSSAGACELRSRLVADVLRCGVALHVIFATLRFREELVECQRALLPSFESDSESESELDSDDEESMMDEKGEFAAEDTLWIVDQVAKVWGLARYRYFIQTTGQEYAFSAWSYRGVGNFMHELLTGEQRGPSALTVIVSPFSWLFHIAAYSHYMIHSEDHQSMRKASQKRKSPSHFGNKLLVDSLDWLAVFPTSQNSHYVLAPPAFGSRDWISPVIQVITNAMVSFSEAQDRSSTLTVLKDLVSKVATNDR
ncbi:unnamed protein product [Phytophthora fragariaefolia]|uniref:Unnamed protein product n=1 Tax=Phytophthora fragariaefolia TaxID=1490495 RepID=A0A9W6Y3U9_9STRA|nr:unnamed protein product [Phytophthora fragariaefolia]